MHARKMSLMRFTRSRWALTALSAVLAIVLITAISLQMMSTRADSAFVGKFIDDNPKLGENGRLDWSFQEYANRAYPASEIPLQASQNAEAAFSQVQQRGHSDDAGGSWQLIG